MPILELDKNAGKRLKKLKKKHRNIEERYKKTKKAFDADHTSPNLDFKKHQGIFGVYKIRLLGEHDGRRLMLKPDSGKTKYYVYDIVEHDDL